MDRTEQNFSGVLSLLDWLLKEKIIRINDVFSSNWVEDSVSKFLLRDLNLLLFLLVQLFVYGPVLRSPARKWIRNAIKLFLDHDADPVLSFELEADASLDLSNRVKIEEGTEVAFAVVYGKDHWREVKTLRWVRGYWRGEDHGSSVVPDREPISFIAKKGGKADLSDMVDYFELDNAEELKELIKKRLEEQESNASQQCTSHSAGTAEGADVDTRKPPEVKPSGETWSDWISENPLALVIAGERQYLPSHSDWGFVLTLCRHDIGFRDSMVVEHNAERHVLG